MWPQFSEPARQVVHRAQQLAIEKRSPYVEAAHLFLAILPAPGDDESTVGALLQVSGVTRDEAELYALAALETRADGNETKPVLSKDAKRIIRLAFQIANHAHRGVINPEHLFIACVSHQRGPHLGETLRPLGLDAAQLKQHLRSLHASKTPYKKGNPFNSLTQQSEKAIEAAHAAMRASFCGRISTSHLLLGLLSDENFASVTMLQDIGADLEDLKRRAREGVAHDGHIATPQKKFSSGAKSALERAAREAKAAGHHFIGTDHLLRALLPQRETWREKLKAGGQNFDSVEGLWTADVVEALKVKVENKPKAAQPPGFAYALRRMLRAGSEDITPAQVLGLTGFILGFIWSFVTSVSSQGERSLSEFVIVVGGIGFLVMLGIGTCCVTIVARSTAVKNGWLSIFAGCIMGIIVALGLTSIF